MLFESAKKRKYDTRTLKYHCITQDLVNITIVVHFTIARKLYVDNLDRHILLFLIVRLVLIAED
jgi:hypothetical protein